MVVKSLAKKFDKLLQVSLDYSTEITSASITGDFFLHPEDKITELEDALIGLKPTDYAVMETKLEAVLDGATLVGFTVKDLVSMIKELTTTKFRFIKYRKFSAAMNMAIDEAICESVKAGDSLPTIRVYGWEPQAISIGYFQGLNNEVDIDKCLEAGVDIVRRRTGGGAVFHDDELTYSIIGPTQLFPEGIIDSYREICSVLIDAFEELGVKAEFSPINDVIVGEKKISGNAQTRREGILLQHGTLLNTVDVDKMFSLLKVGDEKIADKLIQSVKKRVTSLSVESSATFTDLLASVQTAFASKYSLEVDDYAPEELARAKELVSTRYGTDEWTALR